MRAFQGVFLLILLIPIIEIYLLISVGGLLGVFPTVLLVVLTAVLGAVLLRRQGFETWQRFQASMAQGIVPAYELVEGPLLLIAGALLLTPGFFTDAVGFICLVPQLRRKIARYIIENHLIDGSVFSGTAGSKKDTQVLEGEYNKEE
ncbi:FxsA family protein [Methylicorpusculum oleiharenae]|uniref:FxsA family protein n=1 Tax=Methylicorpusculum oleiharenae TaxID=1338687 RepID=UPI0013590A83|nr:FxsA family protein [Methylicorpusculum oleiharenae]MCD2450682.1 FxsA family protein [Methylicorpusculum oleiharenae]